MRSHARVHPEQKGTRLSVRSKRSAGPQDILWHFQHHIHEQREMLHRGTHLCRRSDALMEIGLEHWRFQKIIAARECVVCHYVRSHAAESHGNIHGIM